MNINLQNYIDNQKDLDFHPKFWEKPVSEIMLKLEGCYEKSLGRIEELSGRNNLNIHERGLLTGARKFIEIATA
jgi:hypothetical protein